MKKKLISLFMALAVVLNLTPAFAETEAGAEKVYFYYSNDFTTMETDLPLQLSFKKDANGLTNKMGVVREENGNEFLQAESTDATLEIGDVNLFVTDFFDKYETDNENNLVLSMKVYYGENQSKMSLRYRPVTGSTVTLGDFYADGYFKLAASSKKHTITSGQWVKFDFALNLANRTVSIYQNDVLVEENVVYTTNEVTSIKSFRLYMGKRNVGLKFNMDDISLYSATAPIAEYEKGMPLDVAYERSSNETNDAGGKVSITAPESTENLVGYYLMWGDESDTLANSEVISYIEATGNAECEIPSETSIPDGATKLYAFAKYFTGLSEPFTVDIINTPDDTEETPYYYFSNDFTTMDTKGITFTLKTNVNGETNKMGIVREADGNEFFRTESLDSTIEVCDMYFNVNSYFDKYETDNEDNIVFSMKVRYDENPLQVSLRYSPVTGSTVTLGEFVSGGYFRLNTTKKHHTITPGEWVKFDFALNLANRTVSIYQNDVLVEEDAVYTTNEVTSIKFFRLYMGKRDVGTTFNIDDISIYSASLPAGEEEKAKPSNAVYEKNSETAGNAGGKVYITAPENTENLTGYYIMWGDEEGTLENYSAFPFIESSGDAVYEISDGVLIPEGATKMYVFARYTSGLSEPFTVDVTNAFKEGSEEANFFVVTDLHIEKTMPAYVSKAAEKIVPEADENTVAVFGVGDSVSDASEEQWQCFADWKQMFFTENNIAFYNSPGNHEFTVQTDSGKVFELTNAELFERFKVYNPEADWYYYNYLEGKYFIHIWPFYDSDTQLIWLESLLDKAYNEGAEAYIFSHYPLKNTVNGSLDGAGSGNYVSDAAYADEIREIINSHPNATVFSGHMHTSLENENFAKWGAGETASYFSAGHLETATGMSVKCYSDCDVVYGINYLTNKISPNATYIIPKTYKKAEEINETEVSVTVVNGKCKVSVNGSDKADAAHKTTYPIGTKLIYTSEPEDENQRFLYWFDAESKMILSTTESIEVTVGSKAEYVAVYADKTQEIYVTFKSNRKILTAGLKDSVEIPQDPYMAGYSFVGWYTEDKKATEAVLDVAENTVYIAGFKANDEKYTVTVYGAVEESGDYKYNEKVTLCAKEPEDGFVFSHWSRDGKIVSYDTTYSFYVNTDTTVTANYAQSATERQIVLIMAEPVIAGENSDKIAFYAERNIPEEYTVIETGILLSQDSTFDLNTNGVIKAKASSVANVGQFTIRKANVKAGETWNAKAYLIYSDRKNVYTVYSETVSATL